ncbi:PREDICTED: protein phosphatase 1 regulatory subunit 32 isoform X1 [Chinchilla lanigera]|nr:PREDICTED: protein phosphatase 1 regulatory subunit 32 isoform X1 [Chinchilla lanigera]
MTGKLPLGVISPYVKMSSGGCTDPLNFYATSYCTAYGREEFRPRVGSHVGTGYKSNLRPLVSYRPSLDALDNPAMGEQVRDTFQSVTSKSYGPLEGPDSRSALPWNVYQTGSGYSQEKPGVGPFTKEVKKVHFDTQEHGPQAIVGLEPKAVPLLLQPQNKGSPERENARYGPRFMTSEYNSKYLGEPLARQDLLQKRSIGAKERTGFTEGSATGPLDFQPPCQALPGDPVLLPGCSVTKADFLPVTNPQGSEFLPVLAQGSERETGYSRVNERALNPRVSSLGPLHSSTTHRHFKPPWPMQQTNVALLGRQDVGTKEPTGFSLNNPSYVCSPRDADRDSRYLTTYSQGFFENIPKGLDREGWTRGGVQPLKPSGYVLNQGPTHFEPSHSAPESPWCPHPHRARTPTPTSSFQAPSWNCR